MAQQPGTSSPVVGAVTNLIDRVAHAANAMKGSKSSTSAIPISAVEKTELSASMNPSWRLFTMRPHADTDPAIYTMAVTNPDRALP
jgi:hypothetical protein